MKKGFTLIELLAVIVILAIIALIATPIVLSIIEDTKESATLRSAEHYLNAVEHSIMKKKMDAGRSFSPNSCVVQTDGNLLCDGTDTLEVEVNGEVPSSGTITFEKGKITDVELTLSNKVVTQNNKGELVLGEIQEGPACKITMDKDNDGVAELGDMITCSTESFYVISNDGTTISMLAQYNLDIGKNYNMNTHEYEIIENSTGIQDKDAKAEVEFSTTEYWYNHVYIVDTDYANEGRSYPFAYGDYKNAVGEQQNIIYPYVEAYEEYLKKENVKSADATLISYDQLIELGCEDSPSEGGNGESQFCSLANDWAFTTYYWSGSINLFGIWVVGTQAYSEDGTDLDGYGGYIASDNEYCLSYGIRPVINISTSEL